MEEAVITKRNPIVLIRFFAAIEIAAFALYFFGTFLDEYKQLIYDFLPFSGSFSYTAFKFPFLSILQFLITVYAFLRWYYEVYTVKPEGISHQWGVLFRKEETIPVNKSSEITISAGPLGKILRYGNIKIKNKSAGSMTIADVSRPESILKTIKLYLNPAAVFSLPDVSRLLTEPEHEQLEFKSSFRFDHKTGNVNRELEKTVMKTVAAFLNSKGGHIVIGVDDGRKPIGLAKDYKTLSKENKDAFENHFTNIFNSMIGPEFRHKVNVSFHNLDDNEICVIQAVASERPVYLKSDDNEYFYIRTGNASTALKLSEIEEYHHARFKPRSEKS
ncbi:MAG: RNA-binding domain-containing protein [Candidatus Jorgensenbacteria bacterium]